MTRFRWHGTVLVVLLAVTFTTAGAEVGERWGFFGHRRINRLATFTLPPELMPYFRRQIDYLTEHAVDPDKRRYAVSGEAVRHFMDLDHFGAFPFPTLPRDYAEARLTYGTIIDVGSAGDTVTWTLDTILREDDVVLLRAPEHTVDLPYRAYRRLWYGDPERDRTDSLLQLGLPLQGEKFVLKESFSDHGILPYHLVNYHRRLTDAFVQGNTDRVLQLAAEMGHYVGDAHVPLHTTENYNGQLTGQIGIHAFWESRLPELFADETYDYFVGPAEYIEDPTEYYWNIVLESHQLVDSVLTTEKRLSERFPADRQQCYEERLGRQVRTQCTEYAHAWSEAMDGMVEDRFRAAIRSVGSVWYSCWVDAGQPDLDLDVPAFKETKDTLPYPALLQPLRTHE